MRCCRRRALAGAADALLRLPRFPRRRSALQGRGSLLLAADTAQGLRGVGHVALVEGVEPHKLVALRGDVDGLAEGLGDGGHLVCADLVEDAAAFDDALGAQQHEVHALHHEGGRGVDDHLAGDAVLPAQRVCHAPTRVVRAALAHHAPEVLARRRCRPQQLHHTARVSVQHDHRPVAHEALPELCDSPPRLRALLRELLTALDQAPLDALQVHLRGGAVLLLLRCRGDLRQASHEELEARAEGDHHARVGFLERLRALPQLHLKAHHGGYL
mmetsp:Transcript_3261/g.11827  ORF Transcript_3261/g.11827 Transcript_3261/m.11827 type:complete len:272 (+) Transcript_3261:1490-2305(+)